MDLASSPALLILFEKSVCLGFCLPVHVVPFVLSWAARSPLSAASQGVHLSVHVDCCPVCDSEAVCLWSPVPSATVTSPHATLTTSLCCLLLLGPF